MMDDDEFTQTMSGQYGAAEAQMGREMYEVTVANGKALVGLTLMRARMFEIIGAVVGIVGLMGLLVLMPVIVWLWKWAL